MEETDEQIKDNTMWRDGSMWQYIPDDLVIHIFSFLDCNALLQASKTCWEWRRVAADESLWKDLVSQKVGVARQCLGGCLSWYEEFRRLCMNVPKIESECLKEHDDEVYHVMFSPSGKYFSSTGKDGYVVVWELGMPSKVFAETTVAEPPSYTRFSEFNQSETKLLVAGMDLCLFYDGFIKIYQFGKELIELCIVRVEFPNFRGAWYDDNTFLSMTRKTDVTNGNFLQVRAHKAEKKICQHEYQEMIKIGRSCHRNDFIRVADKTKWQKCQGQEDQMNFDNLDNEDKILSKRQKQDDTGNITDNIVDNSFDRKCEKCMILFQTSRDYKAAIYSYDINNNNKTEPSEEHERVLSETLYEFDGTVIGTNLSNDHRYFVYAVRQKVDHEGYSSCYNKDIEIRVYDLENDKDTGELYIGAQSCGEDHVSYIFPSISQDYISCGSENLKGHIWDRKYRILLGDLLHDSGVHSQNGVNATAFCPTDQEVLVTVADDLCVRVWRSRQRIQELTCRKVKIKTQSDSNTEVSPGCSYTDSKKKKNGSEMESSAFGYQDDVNNDIDDKKVTCCYGFKKKITRSKRSKKKEKASVSVVDVDL